MHPRTAAVVLAELVAVLVAGCASGGTYSDAANAAERKAYIACAVTRAFLHSAGGTDPREVVRSAMHQCEGERLAVERKLIEENADKPFGMQFVDAYMQALQAAMLDHIALRLAQSRSRERGERT